MAKRYDVTLVKDNALQWNVKIILEFCEKEFANVRKNSEPNLNKFGIFLLKYLLIVFPNRTGFGSENFLEILKLFFPNRTGIGSETDTE